MTESATFAARVSLIRSSFVAGSFGQTRIAILVMAGTLAAQGGQAVARTVRGRLAHPFHQF